MNKMKDVSPGSICEALPIADERGGEDSPFFLTAFRWAARLVLIAGILTTAYWLMIASDRYVSHSNIIIQKTDLSSGQVVDVSMLVSGIGGVNRSDQLLLREYLLSLDMLKKLDRDLGLRAHYSDRSRDVVSRMWFKDASIEWLHRHYLSRVSVEYDDYAGVLRITAQAYDPTTAQAIVNMLVHEGERYMNLIGHQLAEGQVAFLTTQVTLAQQRFQKARSALLDYQNQKGMVSPQATAESINAIIARLEAQRIEIQTQLASLPTTLVPNHPNILMLKKSLEAVEEQLAQEHAKLTSPVDKMLNSTIEEFQLLQMEAQFTQDIYNTALVALETGRMEATRTLKKVSVLQAPSLPEYPMEPRRIYNTIVTLLFVFMLASIVKLLESIVLDHVD